MPFLQNCRTRSTASPRPARDVHNDKETTAHRRQVRRHKVGELIDALDTLDAIRIINLVLSFPDIRKFDDARRNVSSVRECSIEGREATVASALSEYTSRNAITELPENCPLLTSRRPLNYESMRGERSRALSRSAFPKLPANRTGEQADRLTFDNPVIVACNVHTRSWIRRNFCLSS